MKEVVFYRGIDESDGGGLPVIQQNVNTSPHNVGLDLDFGGDGSGAEPPPEKDPHEARLPPEPPRILGSVR